MAMDIPATGAFLVTATKVITTNTRGLLPHVIYAVPGATAGIWMTSEALLLLLPLSVLQVTFVRASCLSVRYFESDWFLFCEVNLLP